MSKRIHKIYALTGGIAAYLSKKSIKNQIKQLEERIQLNDQIEFFQNIPLFSHFNVDRIAVLVSKNCILKKFKENEIVYEEDDILKHRDNVYFVKKG